MASSGARTQLDHAAFFDSAPTPLLVVDRELVIVEANQAYCRIVGRRPEDLLGRPLFDAFPTNPADPTGDGAENLRASMERARDTALPDEMPVQKYDIADPVTGEFIERFWSPMNIPILDEDGRTALILHRTEEVTETIRAQAARQAANARERQVALTLQRAMLPAPHGELRGLDVATRYRPAEDELYVGGDWFDVVQLDDDAVALAVGDAVGKGLAAATVMGQLRSALSAATHGADGPPEALDTLDRYARTVDGAIGTTVVQVRLDGSRDTVRYSRAGHPPPLVVTADGEAAFLEEAGGPPLAAEEHHSPHPKAEVPFPPGSTLVLYTDGVVERRGRSIDDGLEALADTVRRHRDLDVERLADLVLDELRQDDAHPDDAALVVARSTG